MCTVGAVRVEERAAAQRRARRAHEALREQVPPLQLAPHGLLLVVTSASRGQRGATAVGPAVGGPAARGVHALVGEHGDAHLVRVRVRVRVRVWVRVRVTVTVRVRIRVRVRARVRVRVRVRVRWSTAHAHARLVS